MENKKNKYGFIVLVEVLVVLLFILKLHNNLDECCAIDDVPYYWLIFDYTGKPNLPEMIKVTKPGILGTKKLFAETDYEFADNASEEKSKTGGTIELKGKGKYRGTIKVKIYVYDDEIKKYIGEVSYYFEEEYREYVLNIIVEAKYRHLGKGKEALELLCQQAKENGLRFLCDDIETNNPAKNLFLDLGFKEVWARENITMLKKHL